MHGAFRKPGAVLLAGCGLAALAASVALAASGDGDRQSLTYHALAPGVARADPATPTPTPSPTPTPEPEPPPYAGAIASISLASAGISPDSVVEERDTRDVAGREVFEDPTRPSRIAWYPRFGRPGFRANNTIMAAHINYVGYGNGPFAYLTSASAGDALSVTMDNGDTYTYTVTSVAIVPLTTLDMDAVVFPGLDAHTERVTLVSCGGTFVPRPGGGGEYDSRVVVVAERPIP